MRLFNVDPDKCKRDGICMAACPASLIRDGGDGLPEPLAGREEHCIACGHCVAACPSGALSHSLIEDDALEDVHKKLGLSPEQLRQFFLSRRSIRAYRADPLPREMMERLIKVAAHAPSGHNAQPVQWIVVHGRDKVEALLAEAVAWMRWEIAAKTRRSRMLNLPGAVRAYNRGKDVICRGAPQVVAAHIPKDAGVTPFVDAIIAMAHLELAAHGMGAGACWAGYLGFAAQWPGIRDFLELPEDREFAYFLLMGKPRFRYATIPPRKAPRIDWI